MGTQANPDGDRLRAVLSQYHLDFGEFSQLPVVSKEPSDTIKVTRETPEPDAGKWDASCRATYCREAADALEKHIQAKFDSARRMRDKPPTRKRIQDSEGIYNEGVRLAKIQSVLRELADQHEAGTIPASVKEIRSRAGVERELRNIPELKAMYERAGRSENRADKLARLEQGLMVSNIPGFFPTPEELAREAVRFLGSLYVDDLVLESSAGTGRLVDAVLWAQPAATVHWFEINNTLREFLLEKYQGMTNVEGIGANLLHSAALLPHRIRYDLAILNPPYENSAYIEHIRRSYELLKPGGRLVAFVPNGFEFRKDRKHEAFRTWLDFTSYEVRDLEPGAFKASGTMVSAKMIRIVKGDE